MPISDEDRNQFLKHDLYHALRYLFEGAVAWIAWKRTEEKTNKEEHCSVSFRHQGALGMYTSFMEARALYEFFHKHSGRNEGHVDDPVFRECARTALQEALCEAQKAADHYRIANPLTAVSLNEHPVLGQQ